MKSLARKISIVLGSIVLALLAAEYLLREYSPIYQVGVPATYDPDIGYRPHPDMHWLRTTDNQEFQINHLGTVNFQPDFSHYRKLVFALGDSFTMGMGVPADASYPFQLDLDLNLDGDSFYHWQYGVANLGVAGYGADQELIALRKWSHELGKPAIVLYLGCDNDYTDDAIFEHANRRRSIVSGSPYWGILEAPIEWLTINIQVGIRVRLLLKQLRYSAVYEKAQQRAANRSTAEMELSKIEQLQKLAVEQGWLLIVSWSTPGSSYEWLKDWARQSKVEFADWTPLAKRVESAMPGLSEENPTSAAHNRTWVNGMIARAFARQIARAGMAQFAP